MNLAALLSLLVSIGPASPQPTVSREIVLEERLPAAVIVLFGPSDRGEEKPKLSVDQIVGTASKMLERYTNLIVLRDEQLEDPGESARACGEHLRLSCWTKAVRPAKSLLVISVLRAPDGDRISAQLIDTQIAARQIDEADRSGPRWEEDAENAIFVNASVAAPTLARVKSEDELRQYLAGVFTESFRALLERGRHWEPFGAIEIESERSGLDIQLDGKLIGTSTAGITTLRSVTAGRRAIVLFDHVTGKEALAKDLIVSAGVSAHVTVASTLPGPPRAHDPSATIAFWSGAGIATLGAVLVTAAAVAKRDPLVLDGCAGSDCGQRHAFATFCDVFSHGSGCAGRGVLVAPLGFGLALAGGALIAAGSLFDDQADLAFWLTAIVGIVAGAAVYGTSVIADDRSFRIH